MQLTYDPSVEWWRLLEQGRGYFTHVFVCYTFIAVMLVSIGITKALAPLFRVLCMLIFWATSSRPMKSADKEGTTIKSADMESTGKMNIQCVKHTWTLPPWARLDEECSIVVWCSIRQHVWPPGLDILSVSDEAAKIFGGTFHGLPLELLLHGNSVSAIWHATAYVINRVNSRKERAELSQCATLNLNGVRLLSWDGSFTANLSILCVKESDAGAKVLCLAIKRSLDISCTAELNEIQTTRSEAKLSQQQFKTSLAQKSALRSGSKQKRRVRFCLPASHSQGHS